MPPRKSLLAAAAVTGALLAAGVERAAHGQDKLLDYARVQRTLPKLGDLAARSGKDVLELHGLVEKLGTGLTTPERAAVRSDVKRTVEDYLAAKQEMKETLRDVLEIQPSGLSDQEVQRILHDTELQEIRWEDASFRKCMKDLSGALGVPVRMAYHVVQMNMVTMQFHSAQASTVLGSLCNFFELRYVIQDGEIILFKKLTPNEERFLEYERTHPGVKLKYWEREDASGEYKKEPKKEGE